jgi:putative chitinase
MTRDQLKKIFPNAPDALLQQAADELNTAPARYGLDTRLRQSHFFAQVRQESGAGFDAQVESLNYRPTALQSTFSYYHSHTAEAEADGRLDDPVTHKVLHPANQQAIANKVYANRNGNGDMASGDGWTYRGRGLLQVTGRANYAAITQTYHQLYPGDSADFVANPALMEQLPYTVRAAVCYWIQKGLDKKADLGSMETDVDRITAVINVHTDSYGERRANFKLAFAALQ